MRDELARRAKLLRESLKPEQLRLLARARDKVKKEFDALSSLIRPTKQVWKELRKKQEELYLLDVLLGMNYEEALEDCYYPFRDYSPREWRIHASRKVKPKVPWIAIRLSPIEEKIIKKLKSKKC